MNQSLKGKTIVVTGASRGIGYHIAHRAAQDGANIVVLAKTSAEDPRLPGTIHTAADDMKTAGGNSLALQCDIRFEEQVQKAMTQAVEAYGGIDILINNASAISLTPTEQTPIKRWDLMHAVNGRGTFLCSQAALPHLKKASNPHILNISPPLNMKPRWFANHVAYTMAKYEMSMCTLGMAEEFKKDGIAVNSLWPESTIATAAVKMLGGDEMMKHSRSADIMADAAHWVLSQSSKECTGNFFLDVQVLERAGVTDLSKYAIEPGSDLILDLFLDDWYAKSKTPVRT